MINAATKEVIFAAREMYNTEVGLFDVALSSADTSELGLYEMRFNYELDGAQMFQGYLEVSNPAPTYNILTEEAKVAVERVWLKLGDLYDSPYGGAHLAVYEQTRFDRERIAQLLHSAIGRLNTISQPHQRYAADRFPWNDWGPLAETALFFEVIKHLIRSYVEQPSVEGVPTARTDRRDYMDRWKGVLDMEKADLDSQLEGFKVSHMGLGAPGVLVSGGLYRSLAPSTIPPYLGGRPHRWTSVVY
jgi:hypothetical protein